MRNAAIIFAGLFVAGLVFRQGPGLAAQPAAAPADDFPRFKVEEIDTGLSIGYAVLTADINADRKPDIVVVDQHQVVWYENPGWKKRVILNGKTLHDNVCAAAVDIDGDGKLDLVLGAGWKPFDTKNAGTLQWLRRGKSLDDEWTMYPIPCDEPMVHRVRLADLDGDGKPEVVMAPLMGREATAKGNWMDGRPVRLIAYKIPAKDPEKPTSWKPMVLDDQLHVVHNFDVVADPKSGRAISILTASYEGVHALWIKDGKVTRRIHIGDGDQSNPKSNRGSSEIRRGVLRGGVPYIATVEPWHGNKIVVYSPGIVLKNSETRGERFVVDNQLRWGHAVRWADLDGDGVDELVIGVRDDPAKGAAFTERRGVRLYRNVDNGKDSKWERHILENGGVAVEDLTVADLNGDGKPDIIAVGRQTKNARIYWNQGK